MIGRLFACEDLTIERPCNGDCKLALEALYGSFS